MPRLVRKTPWSERVKAALNPMDTLLWLSEEIETRDWDSKLVGTEIGLGLNLLLLLGRANTGSSTPNDDIFDDGGQSGWFTFFFYPVVWGLVAYSIANAFLTLTRTRKYRLFEADVEVKPATPSARRVQVGSSPSSSSPLRFIGDLIASDSAEKRAHPDKKAEVWELSVWDPLPLALRIFCLFSPGHMLVYMLFFPLAPLDPRPSVTVFNALLMQVILSAQLLFLTSKFAQQAKDNAIVQKEVMHEYDSKYVHPRLHPVVRDVGTQFSSEDDDENSGSVVFGTPTTLIKRSFQTHPNPNYANHTGSGEYSQSVHHTNVLKPQMFTPPTATRRTEAFNSPAPSQRPSTTRKSLPAGYTPSAGQTASTSTSTGTNTNFGGSMGVYSRQNSPLKKATSLGNINDQEVASPRNSREMAAYEQRNHARQSSPTKGSPNPWAAIPSIRDLAPQNQGARRRPLQNERFPSRF